MNAKQAKEQGYIIDTHCYPWVAYKGARFEPDEWFLVDPINIELIKDCINKIKDNCSNDINDLCNKILKELNNEA
jgi:protein-tyrosine phosphatase